MKTRTLADLGVGRLPLADRFWNSVSSLTGAFTERQKCYLAVPTALVIVYVGTGLFRAAAVILVGAPAIPIKSLDWWWIMLFQ